MNRQCKRILAAIAAVTVMACSAVTASAFWSKDDSGSWRWTENGQSAVGWAKIDSKWYYFSPSGQMQTGWVQDGGKWYYLNAGGDMATGWKLAEGKWYFLDGGGSMATGWRLVNGKWYFLDGSGSMATGWRLVNGEWYFLNAGGDMATDWITVKGARYFLDDNGAMQTGVIEIDGDVYYFDESGAMATGSVEINGKTYRFDADGKALGRRPAPDKSFGEQKPSGGGSGGSSGGGSSGSGGGSVTPPPEVDPPAQEENPLASSVSTTRTEESAAQLRFTAKEPGYFYCYIPELASTRARAAAPGQDTIVNNGQQFGIKEGENVISLTGLAADTAYTMYTAAENLYQEITVFDPVTVSGTVDPAAAVAESDKDVAIASVAATAGQVIVRLSKALDAPLTRESFQIYCPAGSQMTITGVTTSNNQDYTLTTSYYRENTYFMEVTLPGGKVLQRYFTGRFDCPEITDPSAERTAADSAFFTFASDRAGSLYCLPVEKTAARSGGVPTEAEVKAGTRETLSAQLNRVTVSGLTEGKAYDLYYLAVDSEGKSTPVLGPVSIPAAVTVSSGIVVEECAAISQSQFRVAFDQPVSGLSLGDFTLSCPRGFLKLGGLTASDGGRTYTLSLKTGSMFKEKVNFTVSVALPGGGTAKGIFYTDLYGPMLTGITASRYTDGTAGFICTSDRPGFVYCMPSSLDYDPNGPRPTVAEVVEKGRRLDLQAGSNRLTLENVSAEQTTVWYVTENAAGFRRNFVDHFTLPDTAVTPPDESGSDPDAPYIISSISGTKAQLDVTLQDVKGNGYFSQMIENAGVTVSGTTVSGQSVFKQGSKYFSVSSDYDVKVYHIKTWGGWEFEPGDYTLTWAYEGFWLNEESVAPDIPGATVNISFTIDANGNVAAQ